MRLGVFAVLFAAFFAFSCAHSTKRSGSSGTTTKKALTEKSTEPKRSTPKLRGGTGSTVTKKESAPAAPAVKKVSFGVDEGVVFSSGQIVKDGSGLKVDLIAYKHGSGIDLKSGRVGTSNKPLRSMGKKSFDSLGAVPCDTPSSTAYMSLPQSGYAFTVAGNKSDGFYKVRVVSVSGTKVTVEYAKCQ